MNIWDFIYKSCWVVLITLGVMVLIAAAYPKIRQYKEMHKVQTELDQDIRIEEDLLRTLKNKQQRLLSDPNFVERIAREELGLAKPGETVFKFVDDKQAPPPAPTSAPRKAKSAR